MEIVQDKTIRNWGMFCHLSALLMLIGIPFAHILAPLIIWLLKKDEHPFINEQGKEALNFQISMTIYALISGVLVLIVIGIVLLIGLVILDIILVIIAALNASNGKTYHYPLSFKFIS